LTWHRFKIRESTVQNEICEFHRRQRWLRATMGYSDCDEVFLMRNLRLLTEGWARNHTAAITREKHKLVVR